MLPNVYENTWASIVVWVKSILREMPDPKPQFIDWEAHSNIPELPNADLIGPMSLAINEIDNEQFQVTFAIGCSTYTQDAALPRQRGYVGRFFDRMQSQSKIPFYEQSSAQVRSVIQLLPGTMIAPMNDQTVRPFQYVQGTGLIVPLSAKN